MEIQLSEKQLQLIKVAINEQSVLQQQAQLEFNKIQKRLDDIVAIILDSKGVPAVEGIQLKDDKLVIPDQEDGTVPFEVVK